MNSMANLLENKCNLREYVSYRYNLKGRYIVFSDIQGCIVNLSNFLEATRNMKKEGYICLGDIVQKKIAHSDNRCIQDVRAVAKYCVAGNHEGVEVEAPVREKVLLDNREFLDTLPESIEFYNVLLFHSSLRQPGLRLDNEDKIYDEIRYLGEKFPSARFALCGHTHKKGVYFVKGGQIRFTDKPIKLDTNRLSLINPGAIGLRCSLENSFAVVDFDNGDVYFFGLEEIKNMSNIADVVNGFDNRLMPALNPGYNHWFSIYAKNDAPQLRKCSSKFAKLADILDEFDPKSSNDKAYIEWYSLKLAKAVDALNEKVAPFFKTKPPLESRGEFLNVFEKMA